MKNSKVKAKREEDAAAEKAKGEGAVVTKIRPPYPNEQH